LVEALLELMMDGDQHINGNRTPIVPEREAWLYENEVAYRLVQKGIEQARRGHFAKPPDLESTRRFADTIPEE
jgi:hypothetical protein